MLLYGRRQDRGFLNSRIGVKAAKTGLRAFGESPFAGTASGYFGGMSGRQKTDFCKKLVEKALE